MEYKQFNIKAFEREAGKWRASVSRTNGMAVWSHGRNKRSFKFFTGIDANTAEGAMMMALRAIDAGAFSRKLHADDEQATG